MASAVAVAATPGCGSDTDGDRQSAGVRSVFTAMPLGSNSDPGGRDIVAAEQMALSERQGRAGAFQVRLVAKSTAAPDGMPDKRRAVMAASQASRARSSLAFVGAFTSTESGAVAPILNRAGLVQVTPTSTASFLTAVIPGTFRPRAALAPGGLRTLVRLPPSDDVQARAVVAYMKEEGVDTVAVADDGGIYGSGLARGVVREARGAGVRVVERLQIDEQSPERSAQSAARERPEALFVAANSSPAIRTFTTKFSRVDPEARIFLPDGLSEHPFLASLGPAQPRTYVTSFVLPNGYYGPRGVRFEERFRDRFGRRPSPFALYGYEAMALVLDAIAALPADTGLGIVGERNFVARRVLATNDRAGAIGSYSVTATGDTDIDLYGAFRVEDGRLTRGRAVTVRMLR